jgi:hypothetical protein
VGFDLVLGSSSAELALWAVWEGWGSPRGLSGRGGAVGVAELALWAEGPFGRVGAPEGRAPEGAVVLVPEIRTLLEPGAPCPRQAPRQKGAVRPLLDIPDSGGDEIPRDVR